MTALAAILEIVGRLPAWLKVALIAFAVFYGMLLYDRYVDDPRVAEDARRGFVAIAEVSAVEAERDLAQRLLIAAQEAAKDYENQLAEIYAVQTAKDAADRIKDATYEASLKAAGRSCPLTDADIEWVQKS
jgi:hypothetical protein